MSQEYTVSFFKAGDYQDNFGNFWCEAAFEGVSEPVRWVVKDPARIHAGDVVYGHIEDAVSKAGKPYNRFKTDKREDYQQQPKNDSRPSYVAHNDDKEDSIARAVALKAAVEYAVGFKLDDVLVIAEIYLAWLKNSSGTQGSGEGSTASPQASQVSQNPGSAVGQTGYAQAKAAANRLKQPEEPLPEAPEDLLGWIQDGAEHGND